MSDDTLYTFWEEAKTFYTHGVVFCAFGWNERLQENIQPVPRVSKGGVVILINVDDGDRVDYLSFKRHWLYKNM